MKLYLAGPSAETQMMRGLASELEEAGHEIVDPWWDRVDPNVPDDKLSDSVLDASISKCIEAINQKAEVIVAVPGTLTLRLTTGAAVEVGMAIANGDPVVLLGVVEGLPFRTRCWSCANVQQLILMLRDGVPLARNAAGAKP